MTETMLERIGAAIAAIEVCREGGPPPARYLVRSNATGEYLLRGATPEEAQACWRIAAARAAVEAMRDLSPEAIKAMMADTAADFSATTAGRERLGVAVAGWAAAIDAILAEADGTGGAS